MRPLRCDDCRNAYDRFGCYGRCRSLVRDGIAHLTHSDWRYGDALCRLALSGAQFPAALRAEAAAYRSQS